MLSSFKGILSLLVLFSFACNAVCDVKPSPTRPHHAKRSDTSSSKRLVYYWSVWGSPSLPLDPQDGSDTTGMTHLLLMPVDMVNGVTTTSSTVSFSNYVAATPAATWAAQKGSGLKTQLKNPNLKVMCVFGGWNLDKPFRTFAASDDSRKAFANGVAQFIKDQELDGCEIDWEYPVSDAAVYHSPEEPDEPVDAANFALMMAAIRTALKAAFDTPKLLSVAVPSRQIDIDLFNFTAANGDSTNAKIVDDAVDFWTLMSYDAVNSRDTQSGNHAGEAVCRRLVDIYTGFNIDPMKMNCGWPMYARYYPIAGDCPKTGPVNACTLAKMQADDGTDYHTAGEWMMNPLFQVSYNGSPLPDVSDSWDRATQGAIHDEDGNAEYFIDTQTPNPRFWSWLNPVDIGTGCHNTIDLVGGVAAFALQQDDPSKQAPAFQALASCVAATGG